VAICVHACKLHVLATSAKLVRGARLLHYPRGRRTCYAFWHAWACTPVGLVEELSPLVGNLELAATSGARMVAHRSTCHLECGVRVTRERISRHLPTPYTSFRLTIHACPAARNAVAPFSTLLSNAAFRSATHSAAPWEAPCAIQRHSRLRASWSTTSAECRLHIRACGAHSRLRCRVAADAPYLVLVLVSVVLELPNIDGRLLPRKERVCICSPNGMMISATQSRTRPWRTLALSAHRRGSPGLLATV